MPRTRPTATAKSAKQASLPLLALIAVMGCAWGAAAAAAGGGGAGGAAAAAPAAKSPTLLVLGSSLSDTGNVYRQTLRMVPAGSHGYYQGRFSDGPVWPDYLQQQWQNGTKGKPPLNIINQAYGGATACPRVASSGLAALFAPPPPPDLAQQFAQAKSRVSAAGPASSMAVIVIGVNDLFAAFESAKAKTIKGYAAAVQPAAKALVTCIAGIATQLRGMGIKRLVVANMYPLQLFTPWVDYITSGLTSSQGAEMIRALQSTVRDVNEALAAEVSLLNRQAGETTSAVKVLDLEGWMTLLLLQDAAKQGFSTNMQPCLETQPANLPYLPTSRVVRRCSDEVLKAKSAVPLFFDIQHFTTGVHKLLAQEIRSLLQ